MLPLNVRLTGKKLRTAQFCIVPGYQIEVLDSPELRRFAMVGFLSPEAVTQSKFDTVVKVKVSGLPKLEGLGFLDTSYQILKIGDTFIKDGAPVNSSTMLLGVKILAISVRLGVHSDLNKMVRWLKCFPSVEILHLESRRSARQTDIDLNEYYDSHNAFQSLHKLKKMVILDFQFLSSERALLNNMLRKGPNLEKVTIELAADIAASAVIPSLKTEISLGYFASYRCIISVVERVQRAAWEFRSVSDLCVDDPFGMVHGEEVLYLTKLDNFTVGFGPQKTKFPGGDY